MRLGRLGAQAATLRLLVLLVRPLEPDDPRVALEGESQVTWFEGTWAEYAQWVKETRGPEALEPHRIKYKPLVRA